MAEKKNTCNLRTDRSIRVSMKRNRLWSTFHTCLLFVLLLHVPQQAVGARTLPDTGQTQCYDDEFEISCPPPGQAFYGQDAQYRGPTRSYTKLGENGIVLPETSTYEDGWIMTRDNVTGLVWEMKTSDDSIHRKGRTFTYCDKNPLTNGGNQGTCGTGTGDAATDTEAFIRALNDASYGGFSDWRLPTVSELSHLINSSIPLPGLAIDEQWFPNTIYWPGYWSFAAFGYRTLLAWRVSFAYGNVFDDYRTRNIYFIRVVRGETSTSALTDNGNGTVTDRTTGLTWQRETAPGTYSWQSALSYCENLNLAGHKDWRLPNRNELQSLVVYSRWNPAVEPLLVPYTAVELSLDAYYWSSTTYASDTKWAWYVNFSFPQIYATDKRDGYYVRCVRKPSGEKFSTPAWLQLLLGD